MYRKTCIACIAQITVLLRPVSTFFHHTGIRAIKHHRRVDKSLNKNRLKNTRILPLPHLPSPLTPAYKMEGYRDKRVSTKRSVRFVTNEKARFNDNATASRKMTQRARTRILFFFFVFEDKTIRCRGFILAIM